jgi:hypothetical protein
MRGVRSKWFHCNLGGVIKKCRDCMISCTIMAFTCYSMLSLSRFKRNTGEEWVDTSVNLEYVEPFVVQEPQLLIVMLCRAMNHVHFVLSSHLLWNFPRGLFPSRIFDKNCEYISRLMRATRPAFPFLYSTLLSFPSVRNCKKGTYSPSRTFGLP